MAYDATTAELLMENRKLKDALVIAANALEIASDWDLPAVQVSPPAEGALTAAAKTLAMGGAEHTHWQRSCANWLHNT